MQIEINKKQSIDTMEEQAEIGVINNGRFDRLTPTEADREVRDWFRERTKAIGLHIRVDTMLFGYDDKESARGVDQGAAYMARICDTVFVRSEERKNYTPQEHTNCEDCYKVANTYLNAALNLAGVAGVTEGRAQ